MMEYGTRRARRSNRNLQSPRAGRSKKSRRSIWVKIIIALIILNSAAILFNYFAVPEIKYRKALKLVEEEQFAAAIKVFTELGPYRDSGAQLIPLYDSVNRYAAVGATVYFGTYEQDNDISNGKEKIEWRVLAQEQDKVLLISVKNLESLSFNPEDKDAAWDSSYLRAWLNAEFLRSSFTQKEQDAILMTEVKSSENSLYQTKGGDNTRDKIFILSIAEANKYFSSDRERVAENTAYAVERKAFSSPEGNGWWWLRTPGYEGSMAANVNYSGTIDEYGNYIYSLGGCIRPALWIEQKNLHS